MLKPIPPRWRIGAVIAAVLGICAALYFFVVRPQLRPADLASWLPDKGGTLVYINVDSMRKSGILNMLAGSKAAEEFEYKQFVEQTGFDYKHDLDALAATFRGGQVFFALRGRFDWNKLESYARKQGGSCKGGYCAVDGSKPQRRISFYRLRRDVMGLAVSADDMAAYQITRNASNVNPFTPDAPVWVLVPSAVLKEADALPAGTRAFAMAMQNAERVIFSIGPEGDHLQVSLNVTCESVDAASALLVQLENTTNLLRKMIAREHQQPNQADFSGVLTAGTFRRDDRRVLGQWPLQRAFVDSIAGGAY